MTRVLLTGGSGFIALHILQILIERGYSVVTTVRSLDKGEKIRALYPNVGKEELDFVIVEDIAREGAFDEVVKSDPPFEAAIHTASPFHFNVTNVQTDLLDPAIYGTKGLLEALARNAPAVKQVVITSSFAAVVNPFRGHWPEHTYTENDWNPITIEQASENIPNGYRASKTFSERAAWNFLQQGHANFSISTVCPPQVFGPVSAHLSSLNSLNTSNQVVRDIIQGRFPDRIPQNATYSWVDVRDLALCHVAILEKPEAANKRFLVAAGSFSNREVVEVIRKRHKEYAAVLPPEDAPGGDYPEGGVHKVDNTRVSETLGIKWTPLEDSVSDIVTSLQAIGA